MGRRLSHQGIQMKIVFTFSDGRTFTASNVKIGEKIEVRYTDSTGKEGIRYILVTKSERLVMN